MGLQEAIREEGQVSFATPEDYAECSRLHRQYGTTYYFASRQLPETVRRQVDAVYGFVRVPDEWVDNPGERSLEETAQLLKCYRQQLASAHYGVCPEFAVLRAFADVMLEANIPLSEAMLFLDAMEQDLTVHRYGTYEELQRYMRGSAAAVGMMMVRVIGARQDRETLNSAAALGEAMQLTNFVRDVGEDVDRGRIYLPLEDLQRFGVTEEDVLAKRLTPQFKDLVAEQIARARARFADSDAAISELPKGVRLGISMARELYAMILDKIEANQYDVFHTRARTTPQEKMIVAWRLWSKQV